MIMNQSNAIPGISLLTRGFGARRIETGLTGNKMALIWVGWRQREDMLFHLPTSFRRNVHHDCCGDLYKVLPISLKL